MKKQLTFLLLGTLAFTACKKETQKQSAGEPMPKTDSHKTVNTVMPDYVDLTLLPRAPGENFDTYRGYWNDCGIQVRGPIIYNTQRYPTLVNGVPVTSMSISTYDGTSTVEYSNTGPDGSVFAVTQVYMGSTSFTDFHKDLNTYFSALNIYNQTDGTGPQPLISDAVKDSYTTASSAKTYVGKLIRVTTGSHLAVAKFDYVLPLASTPAVPSLPRTAIIADGIDSHKSYQLIGANGKITAGAIAIDDFAGGDRVFATGSYTYIGNAVFHYWGTLITADGREIKFDAQLALD